MIPFAGNIAVFLIHLQTLFKMGILTVEPKELKALLKIVSIALTNARRQ